MGKAAAAVVVAVNGQRYEAAGVDPSTTLLEFLPTQTPVRGPQSRLRRRYERANDDQVHIHLCVCLSKAYCMVCASQPPLGGSHSSHRAHCEMKYSLLFSMGM
jgi:hypothetical protein